MMQQKGEKTMQETTIERRASGIQWGADASTHICAHCKKPFVHDQANQAIDAAVPCCLGCLAQGTMQQVKIETPRELKAAAAALSSLCEGPLLGDALNNDTGPSFRAVMVLVNQCRTALATIEADALECVAHSRDWHRAALDGIEALGVV